MDEVFKSSMQKLFEQYLEAVLKSAKEGNVPLVTNVVVPLLDLVLRHAGANAFMDVQAVYSVLNQIVDSAAAQKAAAAPADTNAAPAPVASESNASDDSVVANSATSDDAAQSESVS